MQSESTGSRLLDDFLNYIRVERGHSKNTADAYRNDISDLLLYLESAGIKPERANRNHIMDFLLYKRDSLSLTSVARVLAAVKSFYKYLTLDDIVNENPADDIKTPKISEKLPVVLTIEEVDSILQSAVKRSDKIMIDLLYSTGIRVSELIELKAEDIDLDKGWLRVFGKGGKERILPLGKSMTGILSDYISDNSIGNKEHLFAKKGKDHITREAVWKIIKKTTAAAGISKNVTPHTMRHTFATHLLENGADLRTIQELLGHANIDTTQIYTHVTAKNMKEMHKKYHLRA